MFPVWAHLSSFQQDDWKWEEKMACAQIGSVTQIFTIEWSSLKAYRMKSIVVKQSGALIDVVKLKTRRKKTEKYFPYKSYYNFAFYLLGTSESGRRDTLLLVIFFYTVWLCSWSIEFISSEQNPTRKTSIYRHKLHVYANSLWMKMLKIEIECREIVIFQAILYYILYQLQTFAFF